MFWVNSSEPVTVYENVFDCELDKEAEIIKFIIHYIGLGVRVFANGPGDLGSIPGRVIPKTQKMVLDASLLSTIRYGLRVK